MIRALRRPGDGIDGRLVATQFSDGDTGQSYINDRGLRTGRLNYCDIIGVLLIARQPQKWSQLIGLV